ncbi:MAG TPA: hypothetical protein VM536_06775 [Chloroflexia bacterium]|nr:hypothetical protein [Chloroflexia bacterium]
MLTFGSNDAQPNYLLIGLVLGTLAGFFAGAILMLQVGQQTSSAVHELWVRVLGDRDHVRFELLSQ